MTVRAVRRSCGHGAEMLLIKNNYFRPDYSRVSLRYDRPKKSPTILYASNLWLKPVSATGASLYESWLLLYSIYNYKNTLGVRCH